MFDIKDLFTGGKLLVGLDIGSSCIKLVEILETPQSRTLSLFTQMPLPKGVIVDGVVVESETLTATIKEIFRQSGCKRKKIVTSLSGHAVIVKKATFAQMDDEELRALIHDEAGKYLPFDNMSAVDYDLQILGDNPYNPSQMEVLIVAAKKEFIESYTDAIEAAGLAPVIMDVDSFALETMYEENYEIDEEEVVILINIGASITNLNAVKGGTSIFTRDFTIGGNSITEALAANLGVSFEEAEKVKINGTGDDEQARKTFREGLITHADPICSEIERSIDYFRSAFGAETISKILVSGGGAMIPGLVAELGRRMDIETEIVNPFKKIQVDKKVLASASASVESIGPIAAVGVGLALRKIGDK
jgi:type IV pilus assembly protein PilM